MRLLFHRFKLFAGFCLGLLIMPLCGYSVASPVETLATVSRVAGDFGAESEKFRAEQTYMIAGSTRLCSGINGMTRESNGYRLTAMTQSGVAEGMTGISAAIA